MYDLLNNQGKSFEIHRIDFTKELISHDIQSDWDKSEGDQASFQAIPREQT